MNVLVTGATGFVGRWLLRELLAAGHEALGTPPSSALDISDPAAVARFVQHSAPDAIAHLAGVSYGPDARRDPVHALAVNEGGTRSIIAAAAASATPTPVLVVSSSEVYGAPDLRDLPLNEASPLRADQPYGLSKLAQERAAIEAAGGGHVPIVIVRPFNHAGPGQRREFVMPAFAERVLSAKENGQRIIPAGNVEVRRDFSDVRDVVRAYRLILESFDNADVSSEPRIYNVASGRAITIRDIAQAFAGLAGIPIDIEVDPLHVRAGDPPEIRGDASSIGADLGWQPAIPLEVTLKDVFDDVASRHPARHD